MHHGNDFIFGKQLVSFHHSTAWVLMALPKGDPLVGPALKRLEHVFSQPSTLGLATAALAVAFQGKDPTRWIEVLKSRQDSDGSFGGGRVDRTALAAVALRMHQDRVSPFTGEVDWQPTHGVDHE